MYIFGTRMTNFNKICFFKGERNGETFIFIQITTIISKGNKSFKNRVNM